LVKPEEAAKIFVILFSRGLAQLLYVDSNNIPERAVSNQRAGMLKE
jgi:hypothetical protein